MFSLPEGVVRRMVWRHVVLAVTGIGLLAARWVVMGSTVPRFMKVDNPASFLDSVFFRVSVWPWILVVSGSGSSWCEGVLLLMSAGVWVAEPRKTAWPVTHTGTLVMSGQEWVLLFMHSYWAWLQGNDHLLRYKWGETRLMVMMILAMMWVIMMFKFETAENMKYEVQFEMF